MAVKIRLKRMGKIRAPFYRVVVMDSRTKRDGRAIEEIGKYHPTEEPSLIDIDSARAQHWLSQGAQPTEAVEALLKVTGDWQKFKGLDGAEGTLKVKAPKTSKKDLYEAAVAAAGGSSLEVKDTPARKKAPAKATAAAEGDKAQVAKPEAGKAEVGETAAPKGTDEVAAPADAETPVAADTDSGSAAAWGADSSDDPSATTAPTTEA